LTPLDKFVSLISGSFSGRFFQFSTLPFGFHGGPASEGGSLFLGSFPGPVPFLAFQLVALPFPLFVDYTSVLLPSYSFCVVPEHLPSGPSFQSPRVVTRHFSYSRDCSSSLALALIVGRLPLSDLISFFPGRYLPLRSVSSPPPCDRSFFFFLRTPNHFLPVAERAARLLSSHIPENEFRFLVL